MEILECVLFEIYERGKNEDIILAFFGVILEHCSFPVLSKD